MQTDARIQAMRQMKNGIAVLETAGFEFMTVYQRSSLYYQIWKAASERDINLEEWIGFFKRDCETHSRIEFFSDLFVIMMKNGLWGIAIGNEKETCDS